MSYHIHTTDGIVLKRTPIGEANILVYILTRDLGLIMASVQGARVVSSKLRYGLQEYSNVSISCIQAKNGWKVVGATAQGNFYFEYNPTAQRIIAQIVSLLLKLIPDEEIHPEIFEIIETGFEKLKTLTEVEVKDFECICVLRILYHLGYVGGGRETDTVLLSSIWDSQVFLRAHSMRQSLIQTINTGLTASSLT